jgi:hypothetical protein
VTPLLARLSLSLGIPLVQGLVSGISVDDVLDSTAQGNAVDGGDVDGDVPEGLGAPAGPATTVPIDQDRKGGENVAAGAVVRGFMLGEAEAAEEGGALGDQGSCMHVLHTSVIDALRVRCTTVLDGAPLLWAC